MWEMAQNSISLFFRGKLFADPGKAFVQLLIGIVVSAAIFVVLVMVAHALVLLAALVSGLVGGLLQPFLFKNLRFR